MEHLGSMRLTNRKQQKYEQVISMDSAKVICACACEYKIEGLTYGVSTYAEPRDCNFTR